MGADGGVNRRTVSPALAAVLFSQNSARVSGIREPVPADIDLFKRAARRMSATSAAGGA